MTAITREQQKQILIDTANHVISRDNTSQYSENLRELARIALASLDAEPVGEVSEKRHGLVMDGTVDLGGKSTYRIIKGEKAMKRLPLGTKFYIAPPAPVDKEFIPKNLDKALGVVGVALPESKEEFNFQIERWIQRLIDRVIRYADEFKEQPAPVVPESISVRQAISALESADCVTTIGQAYKMGWNACRAAMLQSKYRDLSQPVDPQISEYEKIMLQAGNSPVIPDGYALVPVEPTDEMTEAAMNCEDVLFNSDESFCVQFGNIYEAMLAAAPQHEVK
ncbi:hypothetical protein B9R80_002841 [Salmonella enterica]|nr:hypothetical protein [Salmonella enterica]